MKDKFDITIQAVEVLKHLPTIGHQIEQLVRYRDGFFALCPFKKGDRVTLKLSVMGKGVFRGHDPRIVAGSQGVIYEVEWTKERGWCPYVEFSVGYSCCVQFETKHLMRTKS